MQTIHATILTAMAGALIVSAPTNATVGPAGYGERPVVDGGAASLYVENEYQESMQVYVVKGEGRLVWVGNVNGSSFKWLSIDSSIIGNGADIQLKVLRDRYFPPGLGVSATRPNPGIKTRSFRVAAGDLIEFHVTDDLESSRVTVWQG